MSNTVPNLHFYAYSIPTENVQPAPYVCLEIYCLTFAAAYIFSPSWGEIIARLKSGGRNSPDSSSQPFRNGANLG